MATRHRTAVVAAALLVAAATGCVRPTQPTAAGALPAGCGPRHALRPALSSLPSAPLSPTPLPIQGSWVAGFGGGAGALYASIGPGFALTDTLYTSADGGQQWHPVPGPPGAVNQLDPVAATPDGQIAGWDGRNLWVRAPGGTWHSTPLGNVVAMAADPATDRIFTVAYDPKAPNRAALYDGTAASPLQQHWDLGVSVPEGAAIALDGRHAVVALGGPGAGLTLVRAGAAPRAAPTPVTPPPPQAAGVPVRALAATPDGSLYLLAGQGLYAFTPGATHWRAVPEPTPAARARQLAVAGSTLYLTTGAGNGADTLWRAPASGGPWRRLHTPPGYLGPLWSDGSRVWIGTDAGPALSGPTGDPTLKTDGLPTPVSVVGSAAWHPTTVAAGWSGALFTSRDGGRRWRVATPRDPPTGDITALSWSPDASCLLIAFEGAVPPGTPTVYVSSDAGTTWTRWPGLPPGPQIAPVEWPVGSGQWWLVTSGEHAALYRWRPDGTSWQPVSLPAAVGTPHDIAAGPGGLWLTDTADHLWLVAFPQPSLWARLHGRPAPAPRATAEPGADGRAAWVASDPYDPAVVYAGPRRSTDGGRTWTTSPLPAVQTVSPVAFGPDAPGVATPTAAGLARDAGDTWTTVWSAVHPTFAEAATAAAPAGPGRFYVAVQRLGLLVVSAPSPTWRPTPVFSPGHWTPLTQPGRRAGSNAAVEAAAPSDPAVVYRVDMYGDVSVSHDGGRSFTAAGTAAVQGRGCCTPRQWGAGAHVVPSALAVSPTDPDVLYLGMAHAGNAMFAPAPTGLWVSRDGGRTWEATGLPTTASVFGADVAPDGTLYVAAAPGGVSPTAGSLYRSTDGGADWTLLPAPAAPVSAVLAPRAGEILVGTPGRVLRSADGGATFRSLTIALPGWTSPGTTRPDATVQAIAQAPDGTLFAGGPAGVAERTPDGRWHIAADAIGNPPILPGGLQPGPGGTWLVRTGDGTYRLDPAAG